MNKVLIADNERKIKKFDYDYYLKHKNYQMASAIAALGVANDIVEAFYQDEANLTTKDMVLRLYALLQGLFVSIDALYALAYSITGANNAVNINNNSYMRTLKYIRNDVVGHPANRVINSKKNAYCILDNEKITKKSFTYYIYSEDLVKEKVIDIDELLVQYYKEANGLLDELYSILSKFSNINPLKELISKVLYDFYKTSRYMDSLNKFIDKYKEIYPTSKKEQHRVVWRIENIMRLSDISNSNKDITDLIQYCIGLELNKIHRTIHGIDYKHKKDFVLPTTVVSLYRFLNRNPEYVAYVKYLGDADHPLFYDKLKSLYEAVSLKKMQGAMDYLGFMITLYKGGLKDLVYAIALPILEYRKKE